MVDSNNFSTIATDPFRNFRFLVVIGMHTYVDILGAGVQWDSYLGFTSVSGLAMTIDAIPYREGGFNTTFHQIPGQASFSPITLSRGVTLGTKQHQIWTRTLFNAIQGSGVGKAGTDFRADVEIKVLDHPVTSAAIPPAKMIFNCHNAWITSLAYSDLNAGDNALLVEQMTIVHEGFEVSWANTTTDEAPLFF